MAAWPYCTTRWKKLRLAKLASQPLCEVCTLRSRLEAADTVDHIKPMRQGGEPFPPLDGLMSLCKRCHDEKTASFDRTFGNPTGRRFKGCASDGNPVDPNDGWFR